MWLDEWKLHVYLQCIIEVYLHFLSQPRSQAALKRLFLSMKNESTAGADASVEAQKLYDMKLLTLANLALLGRSSSLDLYIVQKWEMINRDR